MAPRGRILRCGLLVLLACPGCSHRPAAPPLTAEAVYQNDEIGLRFLAPPGWPMRSRAVLPPGALPRPIVLVSYQRADGEQAAEFGLVAADAAPETGLEQFLAEHRVGSERWAVQSPAQAVTVNGAAATRVVLTHSQGKDETRREVTAFRRGGRLYLFLVTFAASDPASRDAVRTSIDSITWTK
jgi:hypothetical protein